MNVIPAFEVRGHEAARVRSHTCMVGAWIDSAPKAPGSALADLEGVDERHPCPRRPRTRKTRGASASACAVRRPCAHRAPACAHARARARPTKNATKSDG